MSKQSEMLTIFDENHNPIGTATRGEAHKKGLRHETFQCWIIQPSPEPALLFQERHPDKDTYPGMLDISSAGHLLAGETVRDGTRELAEELGLEVDYEELTVCGVIAEHYPLPSGLIDSEFCHVHVIICDWPLTKYKLQPDEVTGLFPVPIAVVEHLAAGHVSERLQLKGVRLNDEGRLEPAERAAAAEDFVPHSTGYYKQLLAVVRAMID
jgi:isopentenyldiphosphate isomerase